MILQAEVAQNFLERQLRQIVHLHVGSVANRRSVRVEMSLSGLPATDRFSIRRNPKAFAVFTFLQKFGEL